MWSVGWWSSPPVRPRSAITAYVLGAVGSEPTSMLTSVLWQAPNGLLTDRSATKKAAHSPLTHSTPGPGW